MFTEKNEGMMYKVLAFGIFVILVVLIVMITVSTVRQDSDENPVLTDFNDTGTTPPPDDTSEPDTSNKTDTTEPEPSDTAKNEDTTKAPDTTAPRPSGPAVEPPAANVSAELAAFLKQYPNTVLGLTEDAGQEYIDKMVFLGDSTTYGLRAYSMLSGGRDTHAVWTPSSGTLTLAYASVATIVFPGTDGKEEVTIEEAVRRTKPEYLVITLGVNGVSFMKEDYFKLEYKKMLETIIKTSPDTKIICQSIFPVARSYPQLSSINNEKIRAANKWIVQVADEVGVKYLDTYSVLCDSDGWLPEDYHNGDGIHLKTNSFTLELNNLRTHAYTE